MATSITKIQDIPTYGAAGTSVLNTVITFMVDNHGPFTVSIPKADFTAQRAQQEIDKVAGEISTLTQMNKG